MWPTHCHSRRVLVIISFISLVNSKVDRKTTIHDKLSSGMSCYGFRSSQTPLNSSFSPFPPGCQIEPTNDTDSSPPQCISTYEDFGCGRGVVVVNLDPRTCNGHSRGMLMCCTPCDGLIMNGYDCQEPHCEWGRKDAGQLYSITENDRSCSYKAGRWSMCHPDELRQQRVDSLEAGDQKCSINQTLQLVCSAEEIYQTPTRPTTGRPQTRKPTTTAPSLWPTAANCRYTEGLWSACLNETQTRRRVKELLRGDRSCPKTKEEVKRCFTRSERCFYGRWGPWSRCENGMRTRVRKVLGKNLDDCYKTVKAKMCPSLNGSRERHEHTMEKALRRTQRRLPM